MEKNLDRVMEEILNKPNVIGCVLADQQGLCLGVKGKGSSDISGFITAIVNQASNIESSDVSPIVTLESDKEICMIQKCGSITAAISKAI